ncbi:glycosyl hydrolase family 28 protein [Paenibacillus planticolens]|uniref:Probable pectate lyase C n=1 Tax=Paenibacillus planticolens TaxID=2654976 RepID=A0ABX1ZXF4_9BACL|nr:glycosyl hydrolase family 28 protein [Paenibacillus planticolens]NOV04363.1 carbohydrate-binding protein [Paenibacillus planticolens]
MMKRKWFILIVLCLMIAQILPFSGALAAEDQSVVTVAVPDGTTNLQAPQNAFSPPESQTDSSVLLLWDKPANIYSIPNFAKYVVYRDGVQVGETTQMGYSVSGLSPGTSYTFTLKTRDTSGNLSESSSGLTIRTKASGRTLNVEDYGAVGDGSTVNTAAIQKAIDECPESCTVYIPPNKTFLSGALFLKSNMTIKIDGTLKGTTNLSDYPVIPTRFEGFELDGYASLLTLGRRDAKGPYNISNVVISGTGTIDGNGLDLGNAQKAKLGNRARGRAIMMMNAQNVYVKDLTVSYGPAWTTHFIYSDHVTFDNVKLISKNASYRIANGDGIDPDSSTNANIFNCYFHTGDDSVAIKSGKNLEGYNLGIPTEYIRVTDNVVDGSNGGYVIGSEMSGSVRHVLIQNNSVSSISWEGIDIKSSAGRGGIVEDVTFKDITISKTRLAVRLSANYSVNNDGATAPVLPILRDIHYENIVTGPGTNGSALEITGLNGSNVQNITMKNLNLKGTAGAIVNYADSISFDNVNVTATSGPAWTVSNWANIQSSNPAIQPLAVHPNIQQFDTAGRVITALTGTTFGQLIAQLSGVDGAVQNYALTDADGRAKQASDVLAAGDKLISSAKIGSANAVYMILVASDAMIQLKASHPNVTALDLAAHSLSVVPGTTGADLVTQIESPTGSVQTYTVTDSANAPKASGNLVSGDILVVTAQDGLTKNYYTINVLSISKIYEGETTAFVTSGLGTSTASDAAASGGSYRQFTGTPAVGNWLEYTVNVPAAGTYNVIFSYKTNNNRGTVQLYIDGNAQGAPVDEYASAQGFASVNLGNVTFAAAGDHKFRFVITGKNASSSAYAVTWDSIQLVSVNAVIQSITPVQLVTETEIMPDLPALVTAVYSDNSTKQAAVAWDPIAPSQYAEPGSFTVEGKVAGTSIKAVATITVTEAAPGTIAKRIASLPAPEQGATVLELPTVPDGFEIKIKQSDDLSIIKTDGTIIPPSENKTVNVVLEITRLSDGAVAVTDVIPVLVPGVQVSVAPQVTLHGTDSVYATGPFDLTVGAQHVKGSIYGYDITVHYDPAKVDLLSADALKDGLVIVDTNAVTGQLRILAVAIGDDKAANANGDLLVIHGKAKSLAEPAAVSLGAALVVANGDGAETQLGSASHDLQITYVDKAALNALIAEAQNTVNAAVEGTQTGQYPSGSKAVLNAAIDTAKAVASNPSASQQLVEQAAAALSAALQAFKASVITGIPGDLNGDGKVSIGDLAIVSKLYGKTSTDSDWDQSKFADLNHDGVIDIVDLALIARKILDAQ